jgi:beta-glucanase (GH16 family)
MPTTAPPGWTLEAEDDFSGSSLNPSNWWYWEGQPGGESDAWWDPSHVSVSGGALNLVTTPGTLPDGQAGWISGGVGSTFSQTYGMYEVRMRVDGAAGVSALALLWPVTGWPPEVDFYEDYSDDNTRTAMTTTLHYGTGQNFIQQKISGIDFTQWHTIGVEWLPGQLIYTVDGKTVSTVDSSLVPDIPMRLDMQTEYVGGDLTTATPASSEMQVDWAVQYGLAG